MIVPGSANPLLMAQAGDPLDEYGKIERSVRNRRSAGAYWSRTFTSVGSLTTWTLGFKCKSADIANVLRLFGIGNDTNTVSQHSVSLVGSGELQFFLGDAGGSTVGNVLTAGKFRDPASHYDVLIVWDTTNATASERMRVFINGTRLAAGSATYPAQNTAGLINTAALHRIGALSASASYWFDGYLSHVAFIDGQALEPSAFGQTHPRTGQWRPKSKAAIRAAVAAGGGVRNGWGANGFFLPFDDPTSTTTLGYDRSQSDTDTTGNNWTATNISLTAGATYDSMLDTPTNNFCTLNPLYSSQGTVTDGGLTSTAGNNRITTGTQAVSSGRIQFEYTVTSNAGGHVQEVGILSASRSIDIVAATNQWVGLFSDGYSYRSDGQKGNNNSASAYGATYTVGDVVGVDLNLDAGTLTFYKNGVSQGIAFSGLSGRFVPAEAGLTGVTAVSKTLNFGQRYFAYPIAGTKAICTKNLPVKPAGPMKSSSAFVSVTDIGANIQATLAAASPWSDWIRIIKRRDSAEGWRFIFSDDPGNYLDTSTTNAKAALPAFGGTSYVGYALRVSAATGIATGTFNHVNGANSVINDGLSNARKMVILHRESAGGGSFFVYHPDLTAGKLLYLDQAVGETADASINTVTSGGFTVASTLPSGTYRWISIAELDGLLKLSKDVGNGSADGVFGNTGIRAGLLCRKRIDAANAAGAAWLVADSIRDQGNMMSFRLSLQSNVAELTNGWYVDGLSNGYKLRESSADVNASGGSFVMLSIAAFPFRYANAR